MGYVMNTCKFEIIKKEELCNKVSSDTLYIIGNGFDLLHGAKSSYFDFEKTIGKNNILRFIVESYIPLSKNELWGNFEDSLAHIDRGAVLYGLDTFLEDFDVSEEDDDDFSEADFFSCIDHALTPMYVLTEELPIRFRNWINTIKIESKERPLQKILIPNAKFINFNYTEFLETLYKVPKSNVLYIHGDRRNKKEKLVLGHGRDPDEMFDIWYEKHKPKKISSNDIVSLGYYYDGDDYDMWKSQTRFDAAQQAMDRIEEYYEGSAKKTTDVIKKNNRYFQSLNQTHDIVIIGHSLSFVDYPYFDKIIESHSNYKKINWYISYYSENDIKRIEEFKNKIGLDFNQIKIFKIS